MYRLKTAVLSILQSTSSVTDVHCQLTNCTLCQKKHKYFNTIVSSLIATLDIIGPLHIASHRPPALLLPFHNLFDFSLVQLLRSQYVGVTQLTSFLENQSIKCKKFFSNPTGSSRDYNAFEQTKNFCFISLIQIKHILFILHYTYICV